MVQCRTCKDWYHQGAAACIHTDYAFDRDDFAEGEDYLCQTCLAAVPDLAFLHQYPTKPLTDRPAWQPHPPQTPATPATPASGLASPPPSPSSSSAAVTPAAPAAGAVAVAQGAAVAEGGEGEEEREPECCAICHRPAVAGAPACLSALVTCTGRWPQPMLDEATATGAEEGEEDDRKPSAAEAGAQEEQEEEAGGACGRSYHPCCLPRGAAGVRDADGCVVA